MGESYSRISQTKNPEEVRICVDMRKANTAVQRVWHITPTVDEIIHDMSGGCVFSKHDLRSGYHQLELDSKSRYITTLRTKGYTDIMRLVWVIKRRRSASTLYTNSAEWDTK